MMKNDYMIKRIIIGVAIGTILMFIRGCDVFALEYVDLNGSYNNCRGIYYTNDTIQYSIGTPTVYNSNSENYTYCKFSSGTSLNNNYKFTFFSMRRSLLNPVPNFEVGKKYNINFFVRTSFFNASQGSQQGPSNLIDFKFSPSISGSNAYSLFNGLNTTRCEILKLNDTIQDDITVFYNYRVSCKDVVFTDNTVNANSYYLYVVLDTANNLTYPYIDGVDINNIMNFEEVVSNADIQNSITDPNVDISGFSGDGTSFEPPIYNGVIGNIFTLPLQVFQILSNKLTYACSNFVLTGSQLPFYDYGVWDNSLDNNQQFTLKCLRSYIIDDLHFTYYETLGQIVGYLLIGKLLLKKGRALLKMGELSATDEECWGGLE